MGDGAVDYLMPSGLTRQGRHVFTEKVQTYARELAIEAEREGYESAGKGRVPELTGTVVERAVTALETQKMIMLCARVTRGERGADAELRVAPEPRNTVDWMPSALISSSGIGIGAIANHLHSPWQWLVFSIFAYTGVTGLALTWTGRRHRTRISPEQR